MTFAARDSGASGQALSIGTQLEEFFIERVLGEGGFGITYLAHDTGLGRQVVIKENLPVQFAWRDPHSLTVAPRHTSGDASDFAWSLENFSKEAAMLASLDHPGIVKVLRSFRALGTAYFVMPFVEGVAFDQLIDSRMAKGQPFSEEELRGLLTRLLDALGHLHDRGIYHRDIKPANILIGNDGVPALIDFGSARQRLSERSMTVVESAGYTPFEQLQSRGNVGPWSDLYALGATLYKAITFESPPKAADRIGAVPMVPLASRDSFAGRYSFSFLNSIDRALAVNAADRWQNANEWRVGMDASAKSARTLAPPAKPSAQIKQLSPQTYVDPVDEWERSNGATAAPITSQALPKLPEAINLKKVGVGPVQLPSLYNPTTVVNLALLFTPPLGAYLFAKNENALGRRVEEASQMKWFYGMLMASLVSIFIAKGAPWFLYILWYLFSAKNHVNFVKLTYGLSFDKKSTIKPSIAALACLVVAVFFVEGVHSLVREEAAPATVGEVSSADAQVVTKKDEDVVFLLKRGVAYANGDGVTQDLAEAVRCYQKAADQGLAAAQFNLGVCYARGEGIEKNEAQAVHWYRKAADQGYALAQFNLGFRYDNGLGVDTDKSVAVLWYRKAAEQGQSDAQCNLGSCYYNGEGVAKDMFESVLWYRKSADQGNAIAQRSLGFCCYHGHGGARDSVEATSWFRKSAEQGDAIAQFYLGCCYYNGEGVSKNLVEAAKWYSMAAEQGQQDAQCSLGTCYINGEGVAKNVNEAIKWYRKSADQGYELAKKNLEVALRR
jgi:TPR repeat protein/serine/threonine protein kinase